jgi:hypothetical protein
MQKHYSELESRYRMPFETVCQVRSLAKPPWSGLLRIAVRKPILLIEKKYREEKL